MNTLDADRSSSHQRGRSRICFAAALAIASWIGSPGLAADGPATAALTVHFIGLKTSQGAVMLAVYNSEAAYENSATGSEAATRTAKLEIQDGAAVTTLADLPPGQYAIKAFHDLNGDAKLNTNLFGIPTEPVGFSNDAPVHMHAPSWKETVFVVHAGDNAISIHID
jgi:uncharacterized protein (DUF2141 family)